MSAPYTVYAPHYDRQGLGQWSATLAAFTLTTLLPRFGRRPRTVLDLACGTGTAALAFARAGLEVVGLDRSPGMLAVARRKAREAGARCHFIRGDLRAFAFARPFDLILCAYDSLNYLAAPGDLVGTFSNIRAALTDSGLFVCDLTTARAYADEPTTPQTFDLGPVAYTWATAWDATTAQAMTTLSVTTREDDREVTLTEYHRQRAYERDDVHDLLCAAALAPLDTFGVGPLAQPTLDPPTADAPRIIYVAAPAAPVRDA